MLARWVILMLVVVIGFSTLNDVLEHPVPEFSWWPPLHTTAGYLPLFWCAIAICAPVAEEVFFRGFLFAGLRAARGGGGAAIVTTSLVFTLVHSRRSGWVDLLQVGAVGLTLGWRR